MCLVYKESVHATITDLSINSPTFIHSSNVLDLIGKMKGVTLSRFESKQYNGNPSLYKRGAYIT